MFVRNEKGTNSLGMSDITEHNTVIFVNTSGWVGYARVLTATFQCAMDLKVIIDESKGAVTLRPIPRNRYQHESYNDCQQLVLVLVNNRVFPKVDHSARSDRVILVEYTTGSVVELNFC